MTITLPLTPKVKLALLGAALLLVALLALPFLLRHTPSPEELRVQHLQYLTRLLELYKQQYGFYPQPTPRLETAEGIRHVWGYRAGKPALASCTIPHGADGVPEAKRAACGGEVYDAEGKVIGWKGTLSVESALNSVEVAAGRASRLTNPLGTIAENIPLDPAYAADPLLVAQGFGEYVYAVRAPEDGAEGRGGIQYQLAMTVTIPETGKRFTRIEGDYFVRSEEQDLLPASLIGPGILFDRTRNPIPGRPLHVLLDGQEEGFPNPVIGEGEVILRLLALRTKAEQLREAILTRRDIAEQFTGMPARAALTASLLALEEELLPVTTTLDRATGSVEEERETSGGDAEEDGAAEEESPPAPAIAPEDIDLDTLSATVDTVATNLEQALRDFLHAKSEEVRAVLQAEAERREDGVAVLSGAFLKADDAHEFVLLARDELVKYLDGEGIEDQARLRAGKKIASAIEIIPDVPALFAAEGITFDQPFLTKGLQERLDALGAAEAITEVVEAEDAAPAVASGALLGTGGTVPLPSSEELPSSAVMLTTVLMEVTTLFTDLQKILTGVEGDLRNLGVSIENIDASLRKLSRVLTDENERIRKLFADLADAEAAAKALQRFEALLAAGKEDAAIREVARFAKLSGDFSAFLFSPAFLASVVLERNPGIPDLSAYKDAGAAEYRGVPYPLP